MNDTVLVGDCVELLPTLPQADLILTSPPYGTMRDYGGHEFDWRVVADAIVPALAPGGVLVWIVKDQTIDGSKSGESFRQALYFLDAGLRLHDVLIYRKAANSNPTPNRVFQDSEFMFVFSNGAPRTANITKDVPSLWAGTTRGINGTGRSSKGNNPTSPGKRLIGPYKNRGTVWEYLVGYGHSAPDFLDAHDHPAIFPLTLAKDHISMWTNPGDLVIDPMCGSGTTLRAAKDLNRRYIGIDIHAPYVALAEQRLSQQAMALESHGATS